MSNKQHNDKEMVIEEELKEQQIGNNEGIERTNAFRVVKIPCISFVISVDHVIPNIKHYKNRNWLLVDHHMVEMVYFMEEEVTNFNVKEIIKFMHVKEIRS